MIICVPQDSVSIALGANEIAKIFAENGHEIVRTSSYGLHHLEVLIEVKNIGFFGPLDIQAAKDLIAKKFSFYHSKFLGKIENHKNFKEQTRLIFAHAGLCDPLDFEAFKKLGGGAALKKALEIGAQSIIDEIKLSGLRGRGGAGFPAGIKWQTVANLAGEKFVVCNADEGDSGNFADRAFMESDPFGLFEALAIAAFAVGAKKGYIYVRSEYPIAIEILQGAQKIALENGFLGDFEIEIRVGAGAYVCGEETALLESLEGKRGMVRAKPPIPALEGLFGKPTLVNNVLTFASVPWIILNGGAEYAKIGFEKSKGTMPIQLSGNIKNSGIFELPFGHSLREIIFEIGGGMRKGKFGACQIGGPLGAYFTEKQLDLPFDYEGLANAGGLLGHGSIVVFDDTIDFLQMAKSAFEFCAHESCGKCTPCRIGSTRGMETMERLITLIASEMSSANEVSERALSEPAHVAPSERRRAERENKEIQNCEALLNDLLETMKYGSLCALGGFTPYPAESALKAWRELNV